MKSLDLTGQTFGRLIAVKRSKMKSKNTRSIMWECLCNCGNTIIKEAISLRSGSVKSCGCLHIDTVRKNGINNRCKTSEERTSTFIFKQYKQRARLKGFAFSLTKEDVNTLITDKCFFCGENASNFFTIKLSEGNEIFKYNGIDRFDNTKGYIFDNCVSCCKTCNTAKGELSIEEFKLWIDRIHSKFMK